MSAQVFMSAQNQPKTIPHGNCHSTVPIKARQLLNRLQRQGAQQYFFINVFSSSDKHSFFSAIGG